VAYGTTTSVKHVSFMGCHWVYNQATALASGAGRGGAMYLEGYAMVVEDSTLVQNRANNDDRFSSSRSQGGAISAPK